MIKAQVRKASTFPTRPGKPNYSPFAKCLRTLKVNMHEKNSTVPELCIRRRLLLACPKPFERLQQLFPLLPLSPSSLTSEPPNDVISYLIDCKSFSDSNHRSMARSAERKSPSVVFIIPANFCHPPLPPLPISLTLCCLRSPVALAPGAPRDRLRREANPPGTYKRLSQHPHRHICSINLWSCLEQKPFAPRIP